MTGWRARLPGWLGLATVAVAGLVVFGLHVRFASSGSSVEREHALFAVLVLELAGSVLALFGVNWARRGTVSKVGLLALLVVLSTALYARFVVVTYERCFDCYAVPPDTT